MAPSRDLSTIPSVDRLLSEPSVQRLAERVDLPVVTRWVRASVAALRDALLGGDMQEADRDSHLRWTVAELHRRSEEALAPRLQRVVNGTGIVLHTNLGRAPLPKAAIEQICRVAGGYSSVEIDLETGRRGSRTALVEELLCELTGAEAAAVVNNNAAGVLLTLNTLALGKEAVVSRGQLVEIGGSFRIPDIMSRSGATMVEVGTTNRTHLGDYQNALTERSGLLLAVHPSNYKVMGFSSEVSLSDLVGLGRRHGVPVAHDLGGGVLVDLREYGLPYEPLVSDSVRAAADIVCFSGDKVLGGPQAGVLVGRREAIEAIRQNPLMRSLRCGKLTYAALEATLKLYLNREKLARAHPTLGMLTQSMSSLRRRGRSLLRRLEGLGGRDFEASLEESVAQTGSGALPLEEIPSVALVLGCRGWSAGQLADRLRRNAPPVLGYVREDRLFLDLRTIRSDELSIVADAIVAAAADPGT
ncbi:MAG: L-seryl-tRNA(Sec) selenium transferase [Candidatus Latescibacteria bacterium]|jgi:L-seryl-tRNA(Ser) seleniumtransferase|nr:L-seryl-tRNA(Sec) selenium transferase [Candidatus Latescibacterota bacterium]